MEIKKEAWDNFMTIVDFESDDTNFKIGFKEITKKYGRAYIEYCKSMWEANEGIQSEEEFCKMNGNMPIGFFNNKIK
jgi:hypothetical protein